MVSVEAHLVDEITCEGGIRNVPSKESLNQFTKRYRSYYNIARKAMQFAYIISVRCNLNGRTLMTQ